MLQYVDDALLFYRDADAARTFISNMAALGMHFGQEDSAAGYLGAHTGRRTGGTINITQLGLIQRIIKAMHLDGDSAKAEKVPRKGYLPTAQKKNRAAALQLQEGSL